MNIQKKNSPTIKRLALFGKDPLWIYLLGITGLTFVLVDSYYGYLLSSLLFVFSLVSIHLLYLREDLYLDEKIAAQLAKFNNDFTIYSSIEISDGGMKGYSDYLIVSSKGIFNIRVLDFEGTVSGFENDENWDYIKVVNPYDIVKTTIKNPIHPHIKTHRIIENLLEQSFIKYIPIQSLFVINNSEANFESNSSISVVKVKDLYNYISKYQDRSSIAPVLEDILQAFNNNDFTGLAEQE